MALSTRTKLIAINLTAVIVAFIIAEAFYAGLLNFGKPIKTLKADLEVVSGESIKDHPILGYAPSPNSEYLVRKHYGDSLLYEYSQTIDEFGLRKIQETDSNEFVGAALFFGGSYAFGEGVEGTETSPSIFQGQSDGKLKAINYSYIGYGPHQTLRLLENNLEKAPLKRSTPKIGVLQVIPDHVYRVANKSGWDFFGPEYKLSKDDDELIFDGAFNGFVIGKVKALFFQSHLVKNIFYNNRDYSSEDVDLLAKIIEKASRIFSERYDAEFYVVLWQENESESELYDQILAQLDSLEVNVIEIREVLPGYAPNSPEYFIQFDNHPNEKAHKVLGEYLYNLVQD